MVNTHGGALSFSIIKDAFIGTVIKDGKTIQASMKPVMFNPMTLAFSLVALNMMIKFDQVNKGISKVIDKLENKDIATIESGFETMKEVIEEYKVSNDKQKFIDNHKVYIDNCIIDYRKLCKEYENNIINANAIDSVEEIINNYNRYQFALYGLLLARYIKVVFNGDFNKDYLNNINNKYKEYVKKLNDCYVTSRNRLFELSYSKRLGTKILEYLSVLTNNDMILVERLNSYYLLREKLNCLDNYFIKEFQNRIKSINSFYNEEFELILDNNYAYLKK